MSSLEIIYFSGTGNTKYVAEKLYNGLNYVDKHISSIEEKTDFAKRISLADDIMVLYPICGGNIPIIMRDFLKKYRQYFMGKNLITVVTEAGFSGDGGALAHKFLDLDSVNYKASYHIIMPTNVSFSKIFVIKNGRDLDYRIKRANAKISKIIKGMNRSKYKKVGASKFSYLLGYHLQRKYFDRIEKSLQSKFSIDKTKCIKCKKCISICPMQNISIVDGNIVGNNKCTLCYRCLHACPTNSISLIRSEKVQYKGVDFGI